MRLQHSGASVRGIYSLGDNSRLTGTATGRRLDFEYSDQSGRGQAWFQLDETGQSLQGQWRGDGSDTWRPWSGKRIAPKPGMRWLIILEARWEEGLEESEYAFGDMLKSYFKMAPARHIQVRHRFFHDRDDFIRFGREASYLAEPVTLVVSSHGTERGILVSDTVITAREVAGALALAFNVDLLHLSGCSMMKGPMPARIQEALGDGPRFPVSGYSEVVAWDASAISDFVYLSMILIRHLKPEEAVAQTHLVAPYTGPKAIDGAAFAPMGLAITAAVSPR